MSSLRLAAFSMAAISVSLLAACGGGGDGPTTGTASLPTLAASVQLAGAVDRPATYTGTELVSRAATTQDVRFTSGTTPQSHTYTGASLWSLLNDAGIQTDASRRNDLLSRYVSATGADGYRVIFTLGELSPDFGNKGSLIAHTETTAGVPALLTATDGPFRITAPGDVKGGRYVSNLTRLDVAPSATTVAASAGGIASTFNISGQVNTPMTFSPASLQAMAPTTLTVGSSVYRGVSLWTLINSLGLRLPTSVKNPTLVMYAVATGSDGYRAAVSLGEIDPGFGNKTAIVAYEVNGTGLGTTGATRLIVPGEVRQGRSVSNLVAIEVFTAPVPSP